MSNIVEAEYRVMPERTLPVIAAEIIQIEEHVGKVALDGAIRIGERLKEAKEKVEHGKWENWCSENLNYSKSKAEKLMKIATEYGDENSLYAKTYTCTDLSISKALRLLQVPEEEVETFAENHDIQDMSVKELEAEIKLLKDKLGESHQEKDSLKKDIEGKELEIRSLKESGADPEALAKLEKELEKQKGKVKGLESALKEEQQNTARKISEAVEKEKESLAEESAEMLENNLKEIRQEREELLQQIASLEKKMQNSSQKNTLMFGISADLLQKAFADCKDCIDAEEDEEKRMKMKSALVKVIDSIRGGI